MRKRMAWGLVALLLMVGAWTVVESATAWRWPVKSGLTVGDLFYAVDKSAITRLAAVAKPNVLAAGGVGAAPAYGIAGSATLDFAAATTNACSADLTVTATGALLASGGVVLLGVPGASVATTSRFNAWVSANDTVKVRHCASASADPDSGTFKVVVVQ